LTQLLAELEEIEVNEPAVVAYAGFWKRLAAYLIDLVVLLVPSVVAGIALGSVLMVYPDTEDAFVEAASNVLALLISWIYWATMESSSRQATLGKMALGILVTDMNGDRLSFGRASGRFFAKILSVLIFFVGFLMIGFTEKKQGLHDMIAGSLVINKSA
jgi:uncharacterized RDD family membrane protein YckC